MSDRYAFTDPSHESFENNLRPQTMDGHAGTNQAKQEAIELGSNLI
jgi:hypothetical protein